MNTFEINSYGRKIGPSEPVYIVAEGGLTNWGNLELAKHQVDIAMAAGADAIKFQAQSTEELISRKASEYWYRRLKYKELSFDDLRELRDYCSVRNIDFFITPHTEKDLHFIDKELEVPFFKIGSGESLNHSFLESVGSRGKPVLISFGLHYDEKGISESIEVLERSGCGDIVILHCSTVYPTPMEVVCLEMITRYMRNFDYPVGYSDHTEGWHIPLAAVSIGAKVIEKHIAFDKTDKRSLDCPVSCDPEDLKIMIDQIRAIETALQCDQKKRKIMLRSARDWAKQSVTASQNLKQGHVITKDDLCLKRPGTGLGPEMVPEILGKVVTKDINADEFITQEHISSK